MTLKRFLLDTGPLTLPLRKRPPLHAAEWLATNAPQCTTAAAAWLEAFRGVQRLDRSSRQWLEAAGDALGVLSYDFAAARWHALQEVRLRTQLRHADAFIAATAAANGLTLVTMNGRDFRRFVSPGGPEQGLSLLEL